MIGIILMTIAFFSAITLIKVRERRHNESIRLLSLCLAHLRTTEHKADYESACRLCGVKPYEQEEKK